MTIECGGCGRERTYLWSVVPSDVQCPHCLARFYTNHPEATQIDLPHHRSGPCDPQEMAITCPRCEGALHVWLRPGTEAYRAKYRHPVVYLLEVLSVGLGQIFRRAEHLSVIPDDSFRLAAPSILLAAFLLVANAATMVTGSLARLYALPDPLNLALALLLLITAFLVVYVLLLRVRRLLAALEGKFLRPRDKESALRVFEFMNSGWIYLALLLATIVLVGSPTGSSQPFWAAAIIYLPNAVLFAFALQVLGFHGILLSVLAGFGQSVPRFHGSLVELEPDLGRLINLSLGAVTSALLLITCFILLAPSWSHSSPSALLASWPLIVGILFLAITALYIYSIRRLVNSVYEQERKWLRQRALGRDGALDLGKVSAVGEAEEFLNAVRHRLLSSATAILKMVVPLSVSLGAIGLQLSGELGLLIP